MTQPLQCSTCTHWLRVRKDANWGECDKIGNISSNTHAYFHPIAPADVKLNTRDVFFCAMYENAKPRRSLVEAVQQASRDFNEQNKGE